MIRLDQGEVPGVHPEVTAQTAGGFSELKNAAFDNLRLWAWSGTCDLGRFPASEDGPLVSNDLLDTILGVALVQHLVLKSASVME